MMDEIRLSPSAVLMYETCGKQYEYRYKERAKEEVTAHSLVFGRAVDTAVEKALYDLSGGGDGSMGEAAFREAFEQEVNSQAVQWGAKLDEEDLLKIGSALLRKFAADWTATGFTPLVGLDGRLLTQRKLRLKLSGKVTMTLVPDLFAADTRGDVVVVDFKAPATLSPEGFADMSDQLTAYQIAGNAHRQTLGLPGRVKRLGFFEGVKSKSFRAWHWSEGVLRSERSEQDYLRKVLHVAADVRSGYFPERSAAAYNSPCSLCPFRVRCMADRKMEEALQELQAVA